MYAAIMCNPNGIQTVKHLQSRYFQCGTASILQLFYFVGMRKEIMLSYEVQRIKPEPEPWALFLNLVSRDYGEVISKSMQQHTGTASTSGTADGSSRSLGVNFPTHSAQEFSDQPDQRMEHAKINRERRSRQGLVALKPTSTSNSGETANIVEEVGSLIAAGVDK